MIQRWTDCEEIIKQIHKKNMELQIQMQHTWQNADSRIPKIALNYRARGEKKNVLKDDLSVKHKQITMPTYSTKYSP